MKELSIEQKAKRYDEAIEKATALYKAAEPMSGCNVILETLFPELAESENERIRKALINGFNKLDKSAVWYNGITNGQILDWLEKQGKNNMGISESTKQKLEDNLNKALEKETPESWNEFLDEQGEQKESYDTCISTTSNNKKLPYGEKRDFGYFEKQGEQKLAELGENRSKELSLSLQIQAYLNTASDELYAKGKPLYSEKRIEDIHKCMLMWQKLHNAYFYQKPAWSEEDEKILKDIITDVKFEGYNNDMQANSYKKINWLKSIRDRVVPQPKQEWKQENTSDLTDFENVMMHIGGSFFGENAGLDPNDTNVIKEQANLLLELVPNKEWSEEDEKMIENIIDTINIAISDFDVDDIGTKARFSLEKERDWLKNKLKSLRPQNGWKPSEEQMKALEHFVRSIGESGYASPYDNNIKLIYSLLEELKKLKG